MLHHLPTTIKSFIGKKLLNISRHSEDSVILEFEDHKILLSVQGDCCSRSWFYDIVFPESAKGGVLLDVEEHKKDETQTETLVLDKLKGIGVEIEYFECSSIWDVVIKTDKGEALVRHVNDSNGYYDGMTYYQDFNG